MNNFTAAWSNVSHLLPAKRLVSVSSAERRESTPYFFDRVGSMQMYLGFAQRPFQLSSSLGSAGASMLLLCFAFFIICVCVLAAAEFRWFATFLRLLLWQHTRTSICAAPHQPALMQILTRPCYWFSWHYLSCRAWQETALWSTQREAFVWDFWSKNNTSQFWFEYAKFTFLYFMVMALVAETFKIYEWPEIIFAA